MHGAHISNRILLTALVVALAACTQRTAHVTPQSPAQPATAPAPAASIAASLQSDCARKAASWPNAIEYHVLFRSLNAGQLDVRVERSHYSAERRGCYELLGAIATDGITYQYMGLLLRVGKIGAPVGLLMVVTHDGNLRSLGVLPGRYLDYHCWVGDISAGGKRAFCRSDAQWRALIGPYLDE